MTDLFILVHEQLNTMNFLIELLLLDINYVFFQLFSLSRGFGRLIGCIPGLM